MKAAANATKDPNVQGCQVRLTAIAYNLKRSLLKRSLTIQTAA